MVTPAGVMGVSVAVRVPSLGLSRTFCPVFLMTRRRSATGLKTTPKDVPLGVNAEANATGATAPVKGFMEYSRPVVPTPYTTWFAGRTSIAAAAEVVGGVRPCLAGNGEGLAVPL